MKIVNSLTIKFWMFFKSSLLIICCFMAIQNTRSHALTSNLSDLEKLANSDKEPFIIKGILLDQKGNPIKGKSMNIYIANRETTLETHKEEPQKAGIGKQVEGSGILNMSIEGVEGGGALKMIDSRIVNPNAKTDENGLFSFNLSDQFIEGEIDFIITVDYNKRDASYITITASYPLVDSEGKHIILKIEKDSKVLDLGKVRTLKE